MNSMKTVLLLGALTGLFVAIGGLIGGQQGMVIALILAAAMNFFSYWFSDKMVLRMYNAQPIDESQAPEIYSLVKELAANAGLPTPKVYLIEDETPNAFATGRDPEHAAVAVTRGIVDLLSARELRGVLAHELAHVHNRDILIGSVAATLAGAVMVLATMARFSAFFGGSSSDDEEGGGLGVVGALVISILAPMAAMVIQMAVSRSREYKADHDGAGFARDPDALADALGRLEQGSRAIPMHDPKPQTAHMFIVNPLSGGAMANLFSTHPPMEERISRLRAMGKGRTAAPGKADARFSAPPPPPPPPPPSSRPGSSSGGKIDWS